MSSDLFPLRPYQEKALDALRDNIRQGVINQILSFPTGAGKTLVATYMIHEALARGKRSLFVADRTVLIEQTSQVFDGFGIPHGVVMSSHWRFQPWQRVQVASIQTLARRKWPPADLIIGDEIHTQHRAFLKRIAERDTYCVGLSATPLSKGLGKHYDAVVSGTTVNKLTEQGFLVPFRIFAASEPDMTGAKVSAGEWTTKEASERAMPIVGDCVAEYLKRAADRKFIVFAADTTHAQALQRQFMAAGIITELFTYKETTEERDRIMEEYRGPDSYIRGLISVSALSRGLDVPDVSCVILARPLRSSIAELIQSIGRGLRPAEGKEDCIILDHAGNTVRHWSALMDIYQNGVTELDDGKTREKKKPEPKEPAAKKCPVCKHVHRVLPACPICGHEYPKKPPLEHVPGELKALAAGTPANVPALRQDVYSQLIHVAQERGYKIGWARWKFKELFNGWPDGLAEVPKAPTAKTESWVKSRLIAYAKGRAKGEARRAAS